MTPTGACPAWGLRAPAPPGMGTVLPRLGSGLQRGGRPAHPAGTAKPGSGWGGCWLWGAGGCPPSSCHLQGHRRCWHRPARPQPVPAAPALGCEGCGRCRGAVGACGGHRSGTEEGMPGYRGYVRGVLGYSRRLKGGATNGVMGFIKAFHWGHIRGFLGGRQGTRWGSLGCAEWGAERNNQGDPGATQGGAKGSQYGV